MNSLYLQVITMTKKILFILIVICSIPALADDDVNIVNDYEILIDLTKYDIPSGAYKKAAMKAFIGRDWNILNIGESSVTGKLYYKRGISPVEIDFSQAPIVRMKYTDNEQNTSIPYLMNLKRDMLDKLLACP